ncbi:SNF2 helicase associated domain-containing protein [Vallitalea guaymasensis]|uniref:SNF2 helicase associated domain-containing protein n=1 Tax=Vallitalea guaymasensis TaxID=1185412 RepID=UPI00272BD041|nr:SNF2 helicase associated domain-containing protein [Vallitalea guaymasensis]
MIQFSLDDIRRLCNDKTFMKGVKYYNKGHVEDINFYTDFFDIKVKGTDLYNVLLEFDHNNGKLNYMECNCKAFQKYYGACKHIIAALLTILYRQDEFNKNYINNSYDNVIENFSKAMIGRTSKAIKKTPVNIEITFFPISIYNNYYSSSYNLRIGDKRLYTLKNFNELYKKYKTGGSITYGKEFVFDTNNHYFNDYDDKFINTIGDYYETEKFINKDAGYRSSFTGYKNNIALPETYIKKTLSILENRNFNINYNDIIYRNCKILSDINMKFDVKKSSNIIVITIKNNQNFFRLTKDCKYVFYDNNVYKLSPEKQQLFHVIDKTFNNKTKSIELSINYKHKFVSTILPVLKELGTVHMDSEISDKLYSGDFSCEIYLDKYFDTVKGTINFNYGDYKIGIIPEQKPDIPKDIILVQDIKKEAIILSLLKEASCVKSEEDDFFTIEDESNLYDFIYYYLPKLQQLATIYYSENFKNIHIREEYDMQGGIRLSEESNMLEISFSIEGIEQDELVSIMKSLKEKKRYYKLKNGGFLPLENQEAINLSTVINGLNLSSKDFKNEIIKVPKYRAFYLDTLLKEKNISIFNRNEGFNKLVKNITEPVDMEFTPPSTLEKILRDYQKFGFMWLKSLAYYGFGGILADDMGLGKTIQSIALIKSTESQNPSLVVAPTSLVYNWADEIKKFAPDLNVLILTGNRKDRQEYFKEINDNDVIITSYGLLKRDIEDYTNYLFEYCFIDEAQHIKNPNSLNAKAVKLIPSKVRFALTGTPIENSLMELWSIFDFILPGYLLSNRKFTSNYERPIIKNSDEEALNQLNNQIKPFILRRLKTDVLTELPPKIETKMSTDLTENQKKIYLAYLQKTKKEIAQEITDKGFNKSKMKILAALTRLRQICCHPSTFIEDYKGDSGKLQLLLELVTDAVDSGHRILLFSSFTSMLGIIKDSLDNNDISNYYLDGSTKSEERRDMVNDFNDGDTSVFLISLKAGGTGLNLTGADMVIHYDPWWNPAVEDQATDRAYRIGQDKSVQVFKLITAGTIEERIYQLQQKKKSMIDSIIKPGETMLTKLSEDEIKSLFDL